MFELIYIAIAVFAVLLILSTWLVARKNIFAEQVRAKSVEAIWLTIQAEQEPDIEKSLSFFAAAQKLKNEVAAITLKNPAMAHYEISEEVTNNKEEINNKEETEELSLGQLLKQHDKKYKIAEIYKKYNEGNN
ncbi:hypothetical protein [Pseudoalteromonas neustonica]|uniref:hypothetical protein n=1 Tax=Pseudoalteromonas neustonica TaxID=1840331 RepID=UPI0007DB5CD9|nr:hypothetical protein [Pseudoalteromonas neustonica]